jgi:hypothetical protein
MKLLAVAALALAAVPVAAPAQDARADLFAGYSMLKAEDDTLHGWQAALGFPLSGRLGLVVDVSGHQGTGADGTDLSALALMAGPRLWLSQGRVRPFVHVIAGVVRSKAGIEVSNVEISESATDFGGAAGGGVDVGFGARWALRGAADYRVVKVEDGTAKDPRVTVGFVYRLAR